MAMQPKMRFDCAAAWSELAHPAYEGLPEPIRALYETLRDDPAYETLAQDRETLDVPMPDGLRAAFEAISSEDLAYAARVVYFYGHWKPGKVPSKDKRGATWKFANLADQVLSARLGIERNRRKSTPNGYSLQVHEGFIRACACTRDSWQWDEIGPAIPEVREHVVCILGGLPKPFDANWKEWSTLFKAIPSQVEIPARFLPWLNTARDYMLEEGKCSDDCPDCGKTFHHTRTCPKYPIDTYVDAARKAIQSLKQHAARKGLNAGPAYAAEMELDFYQSYMEN